MQDRKKIIYTVIGILTAILIIWGIFENVGYKNSTEIVIKQSPLGNMSCVEGQGYYFKGFSKTWTFSRLVHSTSTPQLKGLEARTGKAMKQTKTTLK